MSNKIKGCIDGYNYIATQDATDNLEDVKLNKNMSMKELAYSEINPMYFNAVSGKGGVLGANVNFVPYTGSDASREHVINFDLSALYRKLIDKYGKELGISKRKKYTDKNFKLEERTSLIEKAFYENEKAYYTNVKNKLLSDWQNAFARNPIIVNEQPFVFENLEQIDTFIKNKTEKEITDLLYDKKNKIDAIRGFHYFPSKAGNGIRKELLVKIKEFESPESPYEYITRNLGDKNKLDKDSIFGKDSKIIEQASLSDSVKDIFEALDYKTNTPTQIVTRGKLNPLVYNFLLERLLVTNSFNRRAVGDIMQFKGGSLGNSFVESVKRNKQGVSTFYSYYTDLTRQPEGIGTKSRIAIVKDPKESFKSLVTPEEDIDYPDGSTFSLHLAQYKKSNSLGGDIGFNAGIHHKSVGTNYGLVTTFQKHNDFTITNESIRNSWGTKYDWGKYAEKMFKSVSFPAKTISGVNFQYYNPDTDKIVKGTLDNFSFTNMYELWSALGGAYSVNDDGTYTTIEDSKDSSRVVHDIETKDFVDLYNTTLESIVDSQIKQYETATFGFTYNSKTDSIKLISNNVEQEIDIVKITSEDSDPTTKLILDNYISVLTLISNSKKEAVRLSEEQSIKGKYVESISFVSAMKTGQMNVNENYVVDDIVDFGEDTLKYMDFDNRTRGIQLTSEKDVEEAEATLPQQLIGATAFGGFTSDLAQQAYNDIKLLAIESIDEKLMNLVKNSNDLNAHAKLMDYIRGFMVKAIEGKTSTELTNEILSGYNDVTFDVKSLNKIFISAFNSYLTKEGIKKALPGAQFVLKPPHQIYEVAVTNEGGTVTNKVMQGDEFRKYIAKNPGAQYKKRHLKRSRFSINGVDIEDLTFNQMMQTLVDNKIQLSDLEQKTLNKFLSTNKDEIISSFINRTDKNNALLQSIHDSERLALQNMLQDFLNKFAVGKYQAKEKGEPGWIAEAGEVLAPSIWRKEFYIDNATNVNDINANYFRTKLATNVDAFLDFALLNGAEFNYDIMNFLAVMNKKGYKFNTLERLQIQEAFINKKIEINKDESENPEEENVVLKNELERVRKNIQIYEKDPRGITKSFSEYETDLDYTAIDLAIEEFVQNKVKDFENGHTMITQRVPLQSLASVMVNKVVGFIHTEMNTIMANNDHQKLTGGDYDVDKSTAIVMDIRRLLNEKQKKQQTRVNSLISTFKDIANDGRNLLVRESAITTAKLGDISDSYESGKIPKMSGQSFNDRIDSKYNNMLGKDEIGIFAVALKTLSGITSSFYKTMNIIAELDKKIEAERLDGNKEMLRKRKEELINYVKAIGITIDGQEYSLMANVNLNDLSPEKVKIIVERLYSNSGETTQEKLNNLRTELSLQEKSYDILGQFLNLATDNAKELKLNGLNSTMQTAGIYAYGVIMGIKVDKIAEILNNKEVKDIITSAQRNVYAKSFNKGIDRQLEELNNKTPTLQSFEALWKKQKQFKIIGKVFGINQGLKSDSYAIYNFKQMIREIFRDADYTRVIKEQKSVDPRIEIKNSDLKEEINKAAKTFDLVKFIDTLPDHDKYIYDASLESSEPYSSQMIRLFDKIKTSFNILNLIATNNHYRGQFQVFGIAEKVYNQTSLRARETEYLIEHFINNNYFDRDYLDESSYMKFSNMFDLILADQYLKTSFKRNPPFVINKSPKETFDFAKMKDREDFIKYAEKLFKYVKGALRYKNNEFINNLVEDSEKDVFGNTVSYFKMLDNETDNSATRQALKQAAFKSSLGDLANENIVMNIDNVQFVNNLSDVLRMYNLLIYKDSNSQKAFTKYFPVNTINKSKDLSLNYANFLANIVTKKIDFNAILNPNDTDSFVSLLLSNRIFSVSNDKQFKQNSFTFEKVGEGWGIKAKGKEYRGENLKRLMTSLYSFGSSFELDIKKESIPNRPSFTSMLADC